MWVQIFFFFSGMLVQDPTKGNNDVDSIFNQARELGAVEGPIDPSSASSSSRSFAGTGRLLSGETIQSAPQQPETVVHNIIFWSDGFSVNDGPLGRLEDPENAPFLEVVALEVLLIEKNYDGCRMTLSDQESCRNFGDLRSAN